MENNNLRIWSAVQATDPKYTKDFSRGGGFKGTATNATYLARKATEVFGPCGIGWGLEVLDEQYIHGAPLIVDGNTVGFDTIHVIRAKLWYVDNGVRGEIIQYGQTQMVGRNSRGLYTDEEAPKKSLTDAMSKCLSLLGFAADIHLGLYDDNKYVNDLRRKFDGDSGRSKPSSASLEDPVPRETNEAPAKPETDRVPREPTRAGEPDREPPQAAAPRRDHGPRLTVDKHIKAIRGSDDKQALRSAFALAWKQYENPADPKDVTEAQSRFKNEYDKRVTQLERTAGSDELNTVINGVIGE